MKGYICLGYLFQGANNLFPVYTLQISPCAFRWHKNIRRQIGQWHTNWSFVLLETIISAINSPINKKNVIVMLHIAIMIVLWSRCLQSGKPQNPYSNLETCGLLTPLGYNHITPVTIKSDTARSLQLIYFMAR